MSTHTLRKSLLLKAAPATVWGYLTEPEKLSVWFNRPDVALLAGPYVMFGPGSDEPLIWGEVLTARPYSHLSYTFHVAPLGDRSTTVHWTLKEVEGGTLLMLQHEGLPADANHLDLALALDKGWEAHLSSMRDALHRLAD